MSIADKITSIETHIGDIYDTLTLGGADLTGVNKNLVNVTSQLKDRYLDFMNNGTWGIWNNCEKVTGEGTSLSLSPTIQAPMKNILKGNTSQTGTPTPSSPIPVNVVSGDNEINICGKNLANVNIVGQVPSISSGQMVNFSGASCTDFIEIDNTKEMVFSFNFASDTQRYVLFYDTYKNYLGYSNGMPSNWKLSTNSNYSNTKYVRLRFDSNAQIIWTQLEYSSTATTYEPYIGNTYNIDLPVENLFDLTNYISLSSNGITATIENNTGNIILNGTATSTAYIGFNLRETILSGNTISYGGNNSSTASQCFITLALDGTTKQALQMNVQNCKSENISLSSNINRLYLQIVSGTTMNNFVVKPVINKGSKLNSYTPYGTTPIELCKIGNYQDYIYKDSDKWYLHKEIGKVVFNGSENWSLYNYNSSRSVYEIVVDNIVGYTGGTTVPNLLSNRFISASQNASWLNGNISRRHQEPSKVYFVYIGNTNLETFKTFLSSNNASLYYEFATPTNTEITYGPLIYQLEAWYQAKSKNGQTNISQINNDLPFIINSTMLKEV